jgi:uncharacterized protein YbbK (DUF523 family)
MTDLPRVGISQCLLGDEVRYDGGHKRDENVLGFLDEYFSWVPVCPEVEVGMGIPREPVQLVSAPAGVRLVGARSQKDWTDELRTYSSSRADSLATEGLYGFIFKKGSPSCGMVGVELRDTGGLLTRNGVGLFAAAMMRRLPDLPVEDEGHLGDPGVRKAFIQRVYEYQRSMRANSC